MRVCLVVSIFLNVNQWNHTYRHLHAIVGDVSQETGDNGASFSPTRASTACLQMNGKEVFRFAVRCVPQAIEAALKEAGLNEQNLDWLLLHQVREICV